MVFSSSVLLSSSSRRRSSSLSCVFSSAAPPLRAERGRRARCDGRRARDARSARISRVVDHHRSRSGEFARAAVLFSSPVLLSSRPSHRARAAPSPRPRAGGGRAHRERARGRTPARSPERRAPSALAVRECAAYFVVVVDYFLMGIFIFISSDITTRGRHHISRRRSEALGNSEAWRLSWVETMQVRVWSRSFPGFAYTRPAPFLAIKQARHAHRNFFACDVTNSLNGGKDARRGASGYLGLFCGSCGWV